MTTQTNVLIIGRGKSGEAALRHATRQGWHAVLVEDDPMQAAKDSIVPPYDPADLLANVNLVIPSPGVPPSHALVKAAYAANLPVRCELDLAAAETATPIVAITGTNGKTSVTTMITAMLQASGLNAQAVGNIGTPLLDAAQESADVFVVEVSSFQLQYAPTFHPHIAVLLNLADDHLDWHGSFRAYVDAKLMITKQQTSEDILVFNADDPEVVAQISDVSAQHVPFSLTQKSTSSQRKLGFHIENDTLVDETGQALVAVSSLRVTSPHEISNTLAAAAAALAAGATIEGVATAAREFRRLPHRMQIVGQAGGVTFVDDSKATNLHAALAATAAFEHVVLIAGGRNKGLDMDALKSAGDHLRAVVAIGEAAQEVDASVSGVAPVAHASSMAEAVKRATDFAQPGDVVLLSPGCASFDWYGSYAERGDDFVTQVQQYKANDE